jgi:hypothetical protein
MPLLAELATLLLHHGRVTREPREVACDVRRLVDSGDLSAPYITDFLKKTCTADVDPVMRENARLFLELADIRALSPDVASTAVDPEQRAAELLGKLAEIVADCRGLHQEAFDDACKQLDELIERGAVSRERVAMIAAAYIDVAVTELQTLANGEEPDAQALSRHVLASRGELVRAVNRRRATTQC